MQNRCFESERNVRFKLLYNKLYAQRSLLRRNGRKKQIGIRSVSQRNILLLRQLEEQ